MVSRGFRAPFFSLLPTTHHTSIITHLHPKIHASYSSSTPSSSHPHYELRALPFQFTNVEPKPASDSSPGTDLEKHLGVNRNVDHNPNSRHDSDSDSRLRDRSDELYLARNLRDPKNDKRGKRVELSDREWEIRTGRAIYIIQQTLPDFFDHGLITTSSDNGNGKRKGQTVSTSSSSLYSDPSVTQKAEDFEEEPESIYSPKIRLAYTPPVRLPSPFPATLHVEGLPLYMASSVLIRHTLKTLYSDLHIEMKRVCVQTPKSDAGAGSASGQTVLNEGSGEEARKSSSKREKSLFVGLCVRGTARVSGAIGEWEVNSTYRFSPLTGLIHEHTVNSIYPAPHQAVYDALRSSLERVLGLTPAGAGEVTRAEEARVRAVRGRQAG